MYEVHEFSTGVGIRRREGKEQRVCRRAAIILKGNNGGPSHGIMNLEPVPAFQQPHMRNGSQKQCARFPFRETVYVVSDMQLRQISLQMLV